MNVVLYGKPKGLLELTDLLKPFAEIESVSVFEHFPLILDHLSSHTADITMLDADDEISWQYITGRIRKINANSRIVLLSSNMDDAVRAYDAGVFDYLLKPVKENQLERVVRKCD